jgi:dTDP-4-dehydrorhamnose reductase
MQNILITGVNGQLGHELTGLSYTHPYKAYKFFRTGREDLDITNSELVNRYFENNRVDCIINCAAYTGVDKAESNTEEALHVNGYAVEGLVSLAARNNTRFIHVSTDYVFDGKNHKPYIEDDPVNPVSVYGRSKLLGEKAVLDYQYGTVVRTSWLYSPTGKNFFNTILQLADEKNELSVVYDQIGTPTYTRDVARVLFALALKALDDNDPYTGGLYHYSNEGVCSWYDFALEIIRLAGKICKVIPIETIDYPTPAVRPHYSLLSKNKIKSELSLTIPHWKESLKGCINQLN